MYESVPYHLLIGDILKRNSEEFIQSREYVARLSLLKEIRKKIRKEQKYYLQSKNEGDQVSIGSWHAFEDILKILSQLEGQV